MIHGLVLTHGGIGEQMVRVVQMILGPVEGLSALSNEGCSTRQTVARVTDWLAVPEHAAGGLLFIDEQGGSCATAARLAGAEAAGVPVLGGVNLAMLLAFVTWREELAGEDLVPRIVAHARQAVGVVGQAR